MDHHNLLIKFFAQEISDGELADLKIWLAQKPENIKEFNIANELWQNVINASRFEYYQKTASWLIVTSSLGFVKNNSSRITLVKKTSYWAWIAAACLAFIFLLGIINIWISTKNEFTKTMIASNIIYTDEKERATVILPDSTRVILNSASKLEYNGQYNLNSRQVNLIGEAYFDVRTNPAKPFLVKLSDMTISAKGTRFNVLSYNDEVRVEATLEEGIIEVLIENNEPIQLRSGQQVVLYKNNNQVMVQEVHVDAYLGWIEHKMRFNETPLEEVILKIEKRYNVDVKILHRNLLDLKYTGTFIDESIDEVMQMMSLVSPINYRINNRTAETDSLYRKPIVVIWERGLNKNLQPNNTKINILTN